MANGIIGRQGPEQLNTGASFDPDILSSALQNQDFFDTLLTSLNGPAGVGLALNLTAGLFDSLFGGGEQKKQRGEIRGQIGELEGEIGKDIFDPLEVSQLSKAEGRETLQRGADVISSQRTFLPGEVFGELTQQTAGRESTRAGDLITQNKFGVASRDLSLQQLIGNLRGKLSNLR